MLQPVLYGTAKDPNDPSNTDTVIMQFLILPQICKLKTILFTCWSLFQNFEHSLLDIENNNLVMGKSE